MAQHEKLRGGPPRSGALGGARPRCRFGRLTAARLVLSPSADRQATAPSGSRPANNSSDICGVPRWARRWCRRACAPGSRPSPQPQRSAGCMRLARSLGLAGVNGAQSPPGSFNLFQQPAGPVPRRPKKHSLLRQVLDGRGRFRLFQQPPSQKRHGFGPNATGSHNSCGSFATESRRGCGQRHDSTRALAPTGHFTTEAGRAARRNGS